MYSSLLKVLQYGDMGGYVWSATFMPADSQQVKMLSDTLTVDFFFFFNYHHVKLAYKLVENRVLAFFLLPLQQMYNKKLADAPFLKEKTMKYWSKCQIKGQCLHEFCHQNVEFFFTLVVFVKHWSAMLMLIKDCGTQR